MTSFPQAPVLVQFEGRLCENLLPWTRQVSLGERSSKSASLRDVASQLVSGGAGGIGRSDLRGQRIRKPPTSVAVERREAVSFRIRFTGSEPAATPVGFMEGMAGLGPGFVLPPTWAPELRDSSVAWHHRVVEREVLHESAWNSSWGRG